MRLRKRRTAQAALAPPFRTLMIYPNVPCHDSDRFHCAVTSASAYDGGHVLHCTDCHAYATTYMMRLGEIYQYPTTAHLFSSVPAGNARGDQAVANASA